MGKWELTMEPVQEWGEEHEDGAVFGVTLRREPVQQSAESTEAFVRYRTCKVRRLKAATLDRLVSHLLDPCCQEQDYGRILLSTYHTFTSSNKLIETLFQRDHLASELDSIKYTKSSLWTSLQMWLEEFSEDFRDPPMHSSLRLISLQLRGYTALFPLAKRFEALLKKFQAEDVVASESTDHAEHPDLDQRKDLDHLSTQTYFMDFSVTDVAEQLTRMDADLFMKVIPFQCLGCVWSQRDKKENLSPTIWATIAQFNAITNLVITSLLCPSYNLVPPLSPASKTTHRARVIEKWVRVAQGCRELKNFSSLWAILSALQSNPIYRLKKTWAAVSRETMSVFENLCETFPDENWVLTSRDIFVDDGSQSNTDNTTATKASKRCHLTRQMSTSRGTVPYLGTYLTALTMLDTALPDVVEGGLINFEKRRRECEILRQIRQLQASCCQYVLTDHPEITAWIQNQTLLTDQESYELSRQLETSHDSSPSSSSGWNHRALTKKLSSLLTGNDGSKKNADQISLSSSGSSSSELEEMSASQTLKLMTPSLSGCGQNRTEASPSYSRPSSSSGSQQDLSPSSSASPDSHLVSGHKRSASMTSLAFYNRQVDDSCIIRVSMEFCNNGNMYKSLLLTSQDKTAHVIQRALQKHNLEDVSEQEFTLVQLLDQGRELHIPEKANVFYAMSTSANYDFVLRKCPKGQRKHLTRSVSLSSGRSIK